MWFIIACLLPAVSSIAVDLIYSAVIGLTGKLLFVWFGQKAGYAALFILIPAVLLFLGVKALVMNIRRIKPVNRFTRSWKVPGLSYRSYAKQAMDEYVSLWVHDTDIYDPECFDILEEMITKMVTALAAAVCLLVIEWRLWLVVMIPSALVLGTGMLLRRYSGSITSTVFSEVESVKKSGTRCRFCASLQKIIFDWFAALFTILGLLYTAVEILDGVFSLGCAMFLALLVSEIVRNVQALFAEGGGNALRSLLKKSDTESYVDIQEGLQEEQDETLDETADGDEHFSFQYDILCLNLTFSFGEKVLYRPFDLCLVYGNKYLLIGKEGTGKTTLVDLLTGKYKNYGGQILYDDVELHNIPQEELREGTAIIRRDISLLNDTIYRNICMDTDYSQEEVERAVEMAGLSGLIENLPQELYTQLRDYGKELPAGALQSIVIARAVIRGSRLLVADDICSGLPKKIARKIENTLLALDMTVIIVSDREHLGGNKNYDGIIKMTPGKVVSFSCIGKR